MFGQRILARGGMASPKKENGRMPGRPSDLNLTGLNLAAPDFP